MGKKLEIKKSYNVAFTIWLSSKNESERTWDSPSKGQSVGARTAAKIAVEAKKKKVIAGLPCQASSAVLVGGILEFQRVRRDPIPRRNFIIVVLRCHAASNRWKIFAARRP